MITTADVHRYAARENLRFDQAEKDYVIVHLLSAITSTWSGRPAWIFKGGTCLRHCYYAGYRFSEDLDFTGEPSAETLSVSEQRLQDAINEVQQQTGMVMNLKPPHSSAGDEQVEFAVEYSRSGPRRVALPAVRVHLTFDESIVEQPVNRVVRPQYGDIGEFVVPAYTLTEIVAEKMRALLQQQDKWPRPRDLYDLWFILAHKREPIPRSTLMRIFAEKCRVRSIPPTVEALTSEELKEWNRQSWETQVVPMLADPPVYQHVWDEWVTVCRGLQ